MNSVSDDIRATVKFAWRCGITISAITIGSRAMSKLYAELHTRPHNRGPVTIDCDPGPVVVSEEA